MSIAAPNNTLRKQLAGRPLNMRRSLAQVSCGTIANRVSAYGKWTEPLTVPKGMTKPEHHTLEFYLFEHAMGVLRMRYGEDEPLPPDVVELCDSYNERCMGIALRAFYYLLLICCRESRHVHNKQDTAELCASADIPTSVGYELLHAFPDEAKIDLVCKGLQGSNIKYRPLGAMTQWLEDVFFRGKFGGGYGGPAWGGIAKCLNSYVQGHTSPAAMVDTMWTLEHNNGSLLNKNMLWHTQHSVGLKEILDVQRSGQIPQLISQKNPNKISSQFITHALQTLCHVTMGKLLGDPFLPGVLVDWTKVIDINGKPHEGPAPKAKPKAKPKVSAPSKPVTVPGGAALQYQSTQIMPGIVVKKEPRHGQKSA